MPTVPALPLDTARRRSAWVAMSVAVGLEFAAGLAALVLVPVDRASGAFPHQGRLVYDLHGALGIALLAGAVGLILAVRRTPRLYRIAAWVGLAGIVAGGAGGLLAADHPLRVAGIALMFVGSMVGGFAYLIGIMEPQRGPEGSTTGGEPGGAPAAPPTATGGEPVAGS
ncbi:MAG: hypothetical protein ACRDYZ_11700 [Acidimicrobiales bacterium]